MKPRSTLLGITFALFTVIAALAANTGDDAETSDQGGNVRVDVVVDMTEAGHKIAHPTPEKPAYYLPLSVGYKDFGYEHHFQHPPPNTWDVEHALAKALYNEGYQLMTKDGRPSLVLVFWWGYMAPQQDDVESNTYIVLKPGSTVSPGSPSPGGAGGFWGSGSSGRGPNGGSFLGGSFGYSNFQINYTPPGGESLTMDPATTGFGAWPSFGLGVETVNEQQMLSLVAGNTIDDHQKFPDPRLDDVVQMTTEPRYYVLISAFDFESWLHHKAVLLWRAHVSTELWGHYFDQVVGTLINTAAPFFGRETKVPHFISTPALPVGRVVVGTPEVTDYPIPPPPPTGTSHQ